MTPDDRDASKVLSDGEHAHEPAYEVPDEERPASSSPTEEELETQTPVSVALGKRDPYAALRSRDYLLYAIGGLIATIGAQMQSVAVGWELYERVRATADIRQASFALGLVGLVQALPVIVLALPAGQMADRFNRKTLVLLGQIVLVFVSLGLAIVSYQQAAISWMYFCLFLSGLAHALTDPARSALLPQLVPEEDLANAVTWNSSRWQVASMVGPALGGVAIAHWRSATPVYVLDAVLACVLFAFIALLRPRPQQRDHEPISFQSLLAGLHFVRNTKLILATITLDMFAVLLGGAVTLLPAYAKDVLGVDASGLGWLRAAPSVGALAMALTIAHLPPMRQAGKSLLWAVIGFGVATIVFGLSRSFWLSLAALFLTGAFDNISVMIRHTLVQVLTPDYMRGRVSAVNNVFIGTSNEIGSFESGVAARFLGLVPAVVFGGIGTILSVLAVDRIWPQVRELKTLSGAMEEQKLAAENAANLKEAQSVS